MEHVTLMVHVTLMEAANIIKVYEGIENGKEVGWLKQCSMGHISQRGEWAYYYVSLQFTYLLSNGYISDTVNSRDSEMATNNEI